LILNQVSPQGWGIELTEINNRKRQLIEQEVEMFSKIKVSEKGYTPTQEHHLSTGSIKYGQQIVYVPWKRVLAISLLS
jgi:hypothetical protein